MLIVSCGRCHGQLLRHYAKMVPSAQISPDIITYLTKDIRKCSETVSCQAIIVSCATSLPHGSMEHTLLLSHLGNTLIITVTLAMNTANLSSVPPLPALHGHMDIRTLNPWLERQYF